MLSNFYQLIMGLFINYIIHFLDPKYGLHNLYICANNIELFHLFLNMQVSCSSEMETYACKTVLHSLIEHHLLKIYSMTTDRSKSIRAMLAADFPEVEHFFDIWHWIKA